MCKKYIIGFMWLLNLKLTVPTINVVLDRQNYELNKKNPNYMKCTFFAQFPNKVKREHN